LLALTAAHEIGLVHGNLKPQNVLLDTSNEIKLTDFGVLPPAGPETAGACYRAPEERDGMPGSPASDIYAAAAILFRCVTGNEPSALNAKGAPRLDQLPGSLRSLTLRALAQDPGERPHPAARFLEELRDTARDAYGDSWRTEGSRVLGDSGSRQARTTAHGARHLQGLAPPGGLQWPRISRGWRTRRRALAAALTILAVTVGAGVFAIANRSPSAANARRGTGGTNTVAPAAHPSSLGPSAFAVFAGAWSGHGGGIDIQANGRFLMSMRTYQWCGQAPPPCDSMSGNEIIDGDQATGQLTSISGEVATGTITHTTDQAATPKGQITITLDPSTDSLNINNISFCGTSAPAGYCGA
jgi:serine/threonine-protein kinase